jgi:hypothetical protein
MVSSIKFKGLIKFNSLIEVCSMSAAWNDRIVLKRTRLVSEWVATLQSRTMSSNHVIPMVVIELFYRYNM